MMGFDFTPVVQKQGGRVVLRLFLTGLPVTALAAWYSASFGMAFFQGFFLGIIDTLVMFRGIKKALPYVDEPKKGLAVMRRYRWYRLIVISSIIILLLKQNTEVLGTFFGLLLTHIFLLIHLVFIAYNLNKRDT